MKVGLIGSGNVASTLGRLIQSKGYQIVQVISRDKEHAKLLGKSLKCAYDDFDGKVVDADLYVVAIADTALYHLDQLLNLGHKPVVHTAGTASKDVLKNISSNYGVLYPIQSLRKEILNPKPISFMVDGSSEEILTLIQDFASSLSDSVLLADDDQRMKFHIAAVVVSNFSNHMYTLAEDFCRQENLNFQNLLPLIEETTERLKTHSPKDVQTGPAVRGDIYTMGKHLQILSSYPDLKYLYLKISESILKSHQNH